MAAKVDYNALRAQTLGAGLDEEAVTVNTRALIDKVLARYSGEWTVLRELLQNAADASASNVTVKFETMPSASVPLPQSSNPSALLQHTILHHTLKRLVVTNNGQAFGPNDWSRLKRIAEGNPDETKIGAFGVGFYSVFGDCEEPFVSSGSEAMAFYWKGNSLFTRRLQLTEAQSSSNTAFVLDYRNTTSPVPSLLSLVQFLGSSLTFVGLSNVELWLDEWKVFSLNKLTAPGNNVDIPRGLNRKTEEGIMRVEAVVREVARLDARWTSIVGWKPKSTTASADGAAKGVPATQSLRQFFSKFASSSNNSAAATKAAKEERLAQELISEDLMADCKATVFLQVNTAKISTSISKSFGQELERATKKPAPKSTKIAVLTASQDEEDTSKESSKSASRVTDVFASVLPSKSGRIYIGFPTHQTTGLSAHVSAPSVIPTVERESIDLNARWVRTWNQEMLRAVGIVSRIAWSAECTSIRETLTRQLQVGGRSKIQSEDVEKVLPQAIHLLNQYTFRDSTPSSQVGALVEESFWKCNSSSSIEILSSRGIMPSQNVRIATSELSFVEGIPVVPEKLFEKASGFVKKLIEYGIITDVTTGDIQKELESQALNARQMIEFLDWLSHKARVNEIDLPGIKSLLDGTVVNDEEDGKVWVLGQIQHFINPTRIPGNMPVPQNTLPFKFTKGIEMLDLERLGWQDLTIVPWLRFLVESTGGRGGLSTDQDLTSSSEFAGQILPVISKQWDGLSQSSKASVAELLSLRTTMPTKMGMRKPSNSYFPSVKLFDDLPLVTVNSVKEKFLVALGVRKTIELDLVFQRLLQPERAESAAAWSHVDLIKYLASVQNDIPRNDVIKLHSTPICTAECAAAVGSQRYRVSDLYEPHTELRSLGLRILHWPGVYRSGSEEGKFLRTLGIRSFPTVPELIGTIAAASTENNITLQNKALRYLIDFSHQHGYSVTEIQNAPVPFLPVEGNATALSLPKRCYTNDKVTIMGFQVLRRDLHPHAARIGVMSDPPIDECATWLIRNPPGTNREASPVFDYFATRLNDINGRTLEVLRDANIVPVTWPSSISNEKERRIRHLPPSRCFLGSGDRYADIFDYVEFGATANTFLLRCGSKHEPTTAELAALVVREPARIFSTLGTPERYLDLLSSIARVWSSLKRDKKLLREMRASAFLLGYIEYPAEKSKQSQKVIDDGEYDDEDSSVRSCQLASPEKIVIADDVINYNLFKASILAAPQDEDLEDFYLSLGSQPLSSLVRETPRVGQIAPDQLSAAYLQKLVIERIKLFYHDIPKDQIKRDASWIEKNLAFRAVLSISVRKNLLNSNISHTEATTAITLEDPRIGKTMFFTPGGGNRDYFNVSQALLQVCLHRPKPQQAIILTTLLETELHKLRSRGYDVSRILRRKAAEARIAEDQRKKQLEEEQKRMEEVEVVRRTQQDRNNSTQTQLMPGEFPDSPDPPDPRSNELTRYEGNPDTRRPRGLFSALTRNLGLDSARRSSTQIPQLPEFANDHQTQSITKASTTSPGQPEVSPGNLQKNLLNAINSSRGHNSSSVSSNPVENDVKETQTFCDRKPGQNISFFGEAASGIKIFLANSLPDKTRFMAANSTALNSYASLMIVVAEALHLSRQSLHIFYDVDSSTIAFNQDRALFFNYRYFETLHLADVQQGKTADAIIYWFVTACHELAHNLVADHSSAHSYYTESFIAQFFTRVAQKIANQELPSAGTQRLIHADPPPLYS